MVSNYAFLLFSNQIDILDFSILTFWSLPKGLITKAATNFNVSYALNIMHV